MKRLLLAALGLWSSVSLAADISGTSSLAISGTSSSGVSCASFQCSVEFNMKIDFGAVCNGVANDDPTFNSAHSTMIADPRVVAGAAVTLVIPSGSLCNFNTCTGFSYFSGLNDLTVVMTGATMQTFASGCLQWGNGSITTTQKAIHTASAGANCVTMITPGDETNFPVNSMVVINGVGYQGTGFPPNWAFFDYLRVNSTPSGQVCFSTPLVYSYKKIWVDQGFQCAGSYHCGSNPYLILMDTSWNHTLKIVGGTWNWNGNMVYPARYAEFDNVTWNGIGPVNHTCFIPSFSQTIIFNNSYINNCNVEADKIVDSWIINGGHINNVLFQSSSIKNITLNGSVIDSMTGTPQKVVCNNSTIGNISFGNSYGVMTSFAGTNCNFTGAISDFYSNTGACVAGTPSYCTHWTYAGGGVIQYPSWRRSFDVPFWAPGTVMTWTGSAGRMSGFPFTIGDNSYSTPGVDGGTLSINTTLTGGSLPPVPYDPSSGLIAIPDIMRNWSCSSCTGTAQAIDWSQAPAQGQPLWTYTNRTYTCTANIPNIPDSLDLNNPPGFAEVGNWVSLTLNVSTADTGPLSSVNLSDLGGFLHLVNQSTGTETFYTLAINLKIAGSRVITPTTVTGAQTGDSVSAPGANSYVVGDTSSSAHINIDQNLTTEPAAQCPVLTMTWQVTR
jgi:hypothetical protein